MSSEYEHKGKIIVRSPFGEEGKNGLRLPQDALDSDGKLGERDGVNPPLPCSPIQFPCTRLTGNRKLFQFGVIRFWYVRCLNKKKKNCKHFRTDSIE